MNDFETQEKSVEAGKRTVEGDIEMACAEASAAAINLNLKSPGERTQKEIERVRNLHGQALRLTTNANLAIMASQREV